MHGALKAQFQADLPRIVPELRRLCQVTAWLIVASAVVAGVAVFRLSAGGYLERILAWSLVALALVTSGLSVYMARRTMT
jgi:hypothetical protein